MRLALVAGIAVVAAAIALALATASSARTPPAGPQGRLVAVKGGNLHVVLLGEDKARAGTLLLLHGASGNLKDMQEAIGRRLSARWRVVLVDRPGHGYSDRLGGREMASPARQADAIAEALDRLGVGRTVVVGHSWSGALATSLSLDHPAHVSGMVLLSAATHPYPAGAAWYNEIAATPLVGPVFATLARPVAEKRLEQGVASVFRPKATPPNYIARTEAMLLLRPTEFVANAEDLVDLKKYLGQQAPRYGAIKVPTTILTADKDDIVSPEIHSRAIHRQIEGSKLVILKGVGHTPHWNAQDRVVEEIEAVARRAR